MIDWEAWDALRAEKKARRRMAKLATPREAEVQKSGIAYLKAQGWQVFRRNTGAMLNKNGQLIRFGEPGQSDTWGITPDGRHFELEFKRHGERPNKAQLAWLKKMNTEQTPAFWVDNTSTLARIEKWLRCSGTIHYRQDSDEYDLGCPR